MVFGPTNDCCDEEKGHCEHNKQVEKRKRTGPIRDKAEVGAQGDRSDVDDVEDAENGRCGPQNKGDNPIGITLSFFGRCFKHMFNDLENL